MPNSKQHLEKAKHNQSFLKTIEIDNYRDWAVVAAFYAAVHFVERLRTVEPDASQQHSKDHQDRLQFVQKQHKEIHKEFHELFNASLLARYSTHNAIQKQFTVDDVERILIEKYLGEIERYVDDKF